MPNAYFTTQLNDRNAWDFTKITVPNKVKPYYQVLTGGQNRRFILATPLYKVHWGVTYAYFSGVGILRNPDEFPPEIMPIPAINSPAIEAFKRLSPIDSTEYWANFFAKALLTSPFTMLTQGNWKIFAKLPFKIFPKHLQSYYGNTNDFNQSIQLFTDDSLLTQLDWGISAREDNLVLLKGLPYAESGRVKWYRKKIQENACPPLLVWYQNHLQAYLLIDGHARLKAYQLEQVEPTFLVISQYFRQEIPVDSPERNQDRIATLKNIKRHMEKGKPAPSDESMNQILTQMFRDYSSDYLDLIAKPIANLDEIWLADMARLKNHPKINPTEIHTLVKGEF